VRPSSGAATSIFKTAWPTRALIQTLPPLAQPKPGIYAKPRFCHLTTRIQHPLYQLHPAVLPWNPKRLIPLEGETRRFFKKLQAS